MPLNKKENVSDGPSTESNSNPERVEELEQRVEELESALENEAFESAGATIDGLKGYTDGVAQNTEEVRERVEELEAVVHELVEAVEIVAAGMDPNDYARGHTVHEEEGSDAYPIRWESEVLDFKAKRYE